MIPITKNFDNRENLGFFRVDGNTLIFESPNPIGIDGLSGILSKCAIIVDSSEGGKFTKARIVGFAVTPDNYEGCIAFDRKYP